MSEILARKYKDRIHRNFFHGEGVEFETLWDVVFDEMRGETDRTSTQESTEHTGGHGHQCQKALLYLISPRIADVATKYVISFFLFFFSPWSNPA